MAKTENISLFPTQDARKDIANVKNTCERLKRDYCDLDDTVDAMFKLAHTTLNEDLGDDIVNKCLKDNEITTRDAAVDYFQGLANDEDDPDNIEQIGVTISDLENEVDQTYTGLDDPEDTDFEDEADGSLNDLSDKLVANLKERYYSQNHFSEIQSTVKKIKTACQDLKHEYKTSHDIDATVKGLFKLEERLHESGIIDDGDYVDDSLSLNDLMPTDNALDLIHEHASKFVDEIENYSDLIINYAKTAKAISNSPYNYVHLDIDPWNDDQFQYDDQSNYSDEVACGVKDVQDNLIDRVTRYID